MKTSTAGDGGIMAIEGGIAWEPKGKPLSASLCEAPLLLFFGAGLAVSITLDA